MTTEIEQSSASPDAGKEERPYRDAATAMIIGVLLVGVAIWGMYGFSWAMLWIGGWCLATGLVGFRARTGNKTPKP